MANIGVSIKPRDEDVEQATYEVLLELVENTSSVDIVAMLVEKQQVIIQAERLKDVTMKMME